MEDRPLQTNGLGRGWQRLLALTLPTKILLGLLLGGVLGSVLNATAGAEGSAAHERLTWWANEVARPIGDVFLRLLFMVVVPLVFSSVVLGAAGLGDSHHLGRVGVRAMLWFMLTSALAAVLGVLLAVVVQPGLSLSPETVSEEMARYGSAALEKVETAQQGTGFSLRTFTNIIPENVVGSAGDNKKALGVILFALLIGVAVSGMPRGRTRAFRDALETFYEACVKILGFAMRLAPVGVFGLIFAVTATLGFEVLSALATYVATAMAGLLFYQFVILPILAKVFGGVSPWTFLVKSRALMITAFSTSSSNATLPTTIRTAEESFGVPRQVAGFSLPLGATMNMNGTAMFMCITVLFLAQVDGVEVSFANLILVVVLAMMVAVGAAGVPGGGLPLMTIILSQVGVRPELIALIIGTDRIVDMTRTVPNITSDLICSLWLARKERRTTRSADS
ncbi:MAG: dicarboxylate/amino acid:cation symporter [Planctomycetota bacterium]|nr:dicarboxylate/amino acid:cation symporter [Planctomycetota bacterium]